MLLVESDSKETTGGSNMDPDGSALEGERRLLGLLLEKGTVPQALRRFREIFARPAALLDAGDRSITTSDGPLDSSAYDFDVLADAAYPVRIPRFSPFRGQAALLDRIDQNGRTMGYAAVGIHPRASREDDGAKSALAVLGNIATVYWLMIGQRESARDRLEQDVLNATLTDEEAPPRRFQMVVFSADAVADNHLPPSEHESLPDIVRIVRRVVFDEKQPCRVGVVEGVVAMYVETENSAGEAVSSLATHCLAEINRMSSRAYSAGISGPRELLSEASQGFRDALMALRTGLLIGRRRMVTTGDDLGAYALLTRFSSGDTGYDALLSTLKPLLQYDDKKGGELVRTLRAYLESGQNVSHAARSLHLHRQSLLYRLKRIAELTGKDLTEPNDRFMLELALKVHDIATRQLPGY